ncbi:MAG: hypothetical protein FWC69_00350 [Defluviitaleaceae bacterium]|nr:hypothetical protein [Defluviitaleaceae bacterium]
MKPFELFIVHLTWADGGKKRPALVYVVDNMEVGVYQITTQFESKSEPIRSKYFKIEDWDKAGLDRLSYVDSGTLINLPKLFIKNKMPIGKLSEEDKKRFIEFLN